MALLGRFGDIFDPVLPDVPLANDASGALITPVLPDVPLATNDIFGNPTGTKYNTEGVPVSTSGGGWSGPVDMYGQPVGTAAAPIKVNSNTAPDPIAAGIPLSSIVKLASGALVTYQQKPGGGYSVVPFTGGGNTMLYVGIALIAYLALK